MINIPMKWWIFRTGLIFVLFVFCAELGLAQDNGYDKRIEKYQARWNKLIPTHVKVQYAGSMGFLSVGTGWDYGKHNCWETDIMLGIVPKYSTDHAKLSFTLKQNYMPWHKHLGTKGFAIEPLACGVYVNTVFGDEFWGSPPDRYPEGYYWVSTKVRFNLYIGQRLTYEIPTDKRYRARSVSLFYEISSNELYIINAFKNSYLKPTDYLHLSIGVKMQWF